MKTPKRILFLLSILIVTAIGGSLRLRAVEQLPIDYDEDDYLGAAQRYAVALKESDIDAIIDYDFNFEHPPLTKLVYGAVIKDFDNSYLIPERPPTDPPVSVLPHPHFRYARLSSAVFGTLEVLALSLVSPLSGLLLGIHTWQIKYTSQIMLEPLPALTSLLTILFYFKSRKSGLFEIIHTGDKNKATFNPQRAYFWVALSAVGLGITAAAKYIYAIVGIVIVVDWLVDAVKYQKDFPNRRTFHLWGRVVSSAVLWGILAVFIFWAFNPRLWVNPVEQLRESVFYHGEYAQSETVTDAGFPSWQQLVWLAQSVPWHPGVFLVSLDLYIFVFALVGLPQLWKRYRVFGLWLLIAGGFLLIWPTKWPQYLLTITAPLSLSAAEGIRTLIWNPLLNWWKRRKITVSPEQLKIGAARARRLSWRELKKAWIWLLPGAVTLTMIAFYPMIYQGAMALTDFSSMSMRDGIQGGVWREAWEGITGQSEPVEMDPFERPTSTEVRYVGPSLLLMLFSGAVPDLMVFNILWTVLSIGLQVVLGVGVAVMLNRRGVIGRGFWRTLFILPWAIPEFVGALIWLRLLDPERGWLAVAQTAPTNAVISGFLADPDKTLFLLLVAATWYGFPFIMLAATAGLKMIPADVYEAAAIDGAGRWGRFKHITWPMLFPLVMPAILIRSIFAFNQFYLFYAMQVNYPTTTFAALSYFFFAPGYFGGRFGVSAAINVFTVIILIVLILWFNRVSRAGGEGVAYA